MKIGDHKEVFQYDGAFKCTDCKHEWGALPGNPKIPDCCHVVEYCSHGAMTSGPCTLCKMDALRSSLSSSSKEISRLKGEVEMANSRVDHLESEREAWGKALKDNHALKAENESLREALSALRNETSGTLKAHELAIRYDSGNSNWRCLEMALEMATKALARTPSSFAEESKALQGLVEAARYPGDSAIYFSRICNALEDLDRIRNNKSQGDIK